MLICSFLWRWCWLLKLLHVHSETILTLNPSALLALNAHVFFNRINSHHIPLSSLNTFHNCRILFIFHLQVSGNNQPKRMHSSRKRTTCLLTVSRSAQKGVCLGRCVCIPAFLWADTPLGRHPQTLQPDTPEQTPPWADNKPPCRQNSWHTLVQTLPSCNYCCGQ